MATLPESKADRTKRAVRLLSLDGGGIRGLSELIIIEEIMHRIQGRENLNEVPLPADYFDLIGGTSTGGIKIGSLGSEIEYVDAGLGYNNPTKQVAAEAARIYGDDAQVACIVSIGTGQSGSVDLTRPNVFEKWLPLNVIEVLKQMATDSGKTAEEMELKYKNLPGIYHRLDVDRGLQSVSLDEWKSLGKVREHTKNYMRMEQIDKRVDNIVDTIVGCSSHQNCEAGQLVGSIPRIIHASVLNNHAVQAAGLGKERTLFMVPFGRDNQFVGREDIIGDVDKKFETEQRVALTGIGGVGKSQIAIEYCYRYRSKHPNRSIFWVHASTFERFDQAYKEIGRKLSLPGWNDPTTNMLQVVSDWLTEEDHPHWLMVLDNSDDAEIYFSPRKRSADGTPRNQYTPPLCSYLPQSSKGSILVTSRNRQAAFRLTNNIEHVIDIPLMDEEDAKTLLHKRLPNDKSREDEIISLIKTLERLPLAITQAAAYISVRRTRMTVAKYVKYLGENEEILLADMGDLRRDPNVPNSVLVTWQMSFDQIKKSYPRAAKLLSLACVLDRQAIPAFLFHKDENRLDFEDAVAPLNDFALITFEDDNQCFGMHRLVQLAMKKWLHKHDETTKWEEEAIMLLSQSFPDSDFKNWKICTALLPHAEVVLGYQYSKQKYSLYQADVLYDTAWYLLIQGKYDMALQRSRRAFNVRYQFLNGEDEDVIDCMDLTGACLRAQGKYEEAEAIHRQTLALSETVLGMKHPNTLDSMNNLAIVLERQGKYEEAEAMHRRTLALTETVLGMKHPNTLDRMEHPDTLRSVMGLAITLAYQGRYQDASILFQRASTGLQKSLGEGHPDTLNCLRDYESLIEKMKR
ncbi:hypothetical protein MMC11_009055 [Xylographa trunciseda]|nr:hypothetical protein [Xylographa trunciseda]